MDKSRDGDTVQIPHSLYIRHVSCQAGLLGVAPHGRISYFHLCKHTLRRHIPTPSILHLGDPLSSCCFRPSGRRMHEHRTVNKLLLADGFDLVIGLEAQLDRVPDADDLDVVLRDGAHARLQPVPLRLVLLAALRDRQRVVEARVVGPERELALRRVAREEVEDRRDEQGLSVAEAGGGCGGREGRLDLVFGERGLGWRLAGHCRLMSVLEGC